MESLVFAGQIFAEMLGGICHPEFYRYVDQEVSPCCHTIADIRLLLFSFNIRRSSYTTVNFRRSISALFTIMALSMIRHA